MNMKCLVFDKVKFTLTNSSDESIIKQLSTRAKHVSINILPDNFSNFTGSDNIIEDSITEHLSINH
jgi:hypothetical protein